ncbi:MAG TPA: DUF3618 domain-containing protein [Mycobacteriales bacterium]|nr:DUF3618 domain-containing protein [Mycobacteriales bacterium]
MSDGKITPYDEGDSETDGGDVAEQRSPDAIQREIEQTRAELADTIDAIADRISPKRAASRGAQAVKSQVSAVLGGNGHAPAAVLDAPPSATSAPDPAERRREVEQIARRGGGATYTGTSSFAVSRRLRVDRVLLAVGALAAAGGIAVLWRSRHRH